MTKPKPDSKKLPPDFTVDGLLPRAGGCVFVLARMAMLRAQELASGKPAMVETGPDEKLSTTAFQEIFEGKVGFTRKNGKPKKAAK